MTRSNRDTNVRERPPLRARLLTQSISWVNALLALAGLYALANAVIQLFNQLTRQGGEVLVNGPGRDFQTLQAPSELPIGLQLLSATGHVVGGLALPGCCARS